MPRFMTIVKGPETKEPPPPELFEAIDKLMSQGDLRPVSFGGLLGSEKGALARITKGKVTVTDGPFTETKEVIGGFAIYEFATLAEAIESSRKFLELHIKLWAGWEGTVEIRQMMDG